MILVFLFQIINFIWGIIWGIIQTPVSYVYGLIKNFFNEFVNPVLGHFIQIIKHQYTDFKDILVQLRVRAQSSTSARVWAFVACIFGISSAIMLNFALNIFDFHSHKKDAQKFNHGKIVYLVVAPMFVLFHVAVLVFAPTFRHQKWVKSEPLAGIVTFSTMITAFIPTILNLDESLGHGRDWWVFGVVVCSTIDFFCLEMVFLFKYEIVLVHTGFGAIGTVVMSLSRGEALQYLWLVITAIVCGILLAIYHWITTRVIADEDIPELEDENSCWFKFKKLLQNKAFGGVLYLIFLIIVIQIIRFTYRN